MKDFVLEMKEYHRSETDFFSSLPGGVSAVKFPLILRPMPVQRLESRRVDAMLEKFDFFDLMLHNKGRGLFHRYELRKKDGVNVVNDYSTGLIWQQSGSTESITYASAEKYIRDLNHGRFAGCNDWRLPTLEEAMSLMEPQERGELYLDVVFDRKQDIIWTADKASANAAWVVGFIYGYCYNLHVDDGRFVRAVRGGGGQPSI